MKNNLPHLLSEAVFRAQSDLPKLPTKKLEFC